MKEINNVCSDCGIEANRLTWLKKYGQEPKKKAFTVSTFHKGKCDVCGKVGMVTEPRDFFYPDFGLLLKNDCFMCEAIEKGRFPFTFVEGEYCLDSEDCIQDENGDGLITIKYCPVCGIHK